MSPALTIASATTNSARQNAMLEGIHFLLFLVASPEAEPVEQRDRVASTLRPALFLAVVRSGTSHWCPTLRTSLTARRRRALSARCAALHQVPRHGCVNTTSTQ